MESCPVPILGGPSSPGDDNASVLERFYSEHLYPLRPCLIAAEAAGSLRWPCRKAWVSSTKSGGGSSWAGLRRFGDVDVQVAVCAEKRFDDQARESMRMHAFLDWMDASPEERPGDRLLYLKDWHFCRDVDDPREVYAVPEAFGEDWLNDHFASLQKDGGAVDDYRFCYHGPAGSWTPVHADVLRSHSWSVNVSGAKEWTLFPPEQAHLLRDRWGRDVVYDWREVERFRTGSFPEDERSHLEALFGPNGVYPEAIRASPLVVRQGEGDAMFVPAGWFHMVVNAEDTLSINHNWINAASCHLTWRLLKDSLASAGRELDDCREMNTQPEWDALCQDLVRENVGMGLDGFGAFLCGVAMRELAATRAPGPAWRSRNRDTLIAHLEALADFSRDRPGLGVDLDSLAASLCALGAWDLSCS